MPEHKMSARHRREAMDEMSGQGSLVSPASVAVEAGHQDALKNSHIKINDAYYGIDPNMDFDSSTILKQRRVYNCDLIPSSYLQPLTWTIQPQYNVFRSLSESQFVFNVSLTGTATSNATVLYTYAPKVMAGHLMVQDSIYNINNVNCADMHPNTAQYSSFVKSILMEANTKSPNVGVVALTNFFTSNATANKPVLAFGLSGDDSRTLTEFLMNTDYIRGLGLGFTTQGQILISADGTVSGSAFSTGSSIEITYRPRDGIWNTPKMLPPGVNLNFTLRLNDIVNWIGYYTTTNLTGASDTLFTTDFDLPSTVGLTINSARFHCIEYTPTQSALKAYQSLIAMQPVYIPVVTSQSLLFPLTAGQTSVQLSSLLAGRSPNIVVVGLLLQSPPSITSNVASGISHQFKTYSPVKTVDVATANYACLSQVKLVVNGRVYPNLYNVQCANRSTEFLTVLYEQYKECCLIKDVNGRNADQSNPTFNPQYKYDNPLLSFGEFRSNFTFFCFNIRRNGTLMQNSGDKEVSSIDLTANIVNDSLYESAAVNGSAKLLVASIQTDSVISVSDGGSTTSMVF
jgi:hypothetical protein